MIEKRDLLRTMEKAGLFPLFYYIGLDIMLSFDDFYTNCCFFIRDMV